MINLSSKALKVSLFSLLLAPPLAIASGDNISVATWNILVEGAEANAHRAPWNQRKGNIVERILSTNADVIGLQEVGYTNSQYGYIKSELASKYDVCQGNAGAWHRVSNPVFIRKGRGLDYQCKGEIIRQGSYACTKAIIKGMPFYNCHFPWRANDSSRMTANFIRTVPGLQNEKNHKNPYVMLGDLNMSTLGNPSSFNSLKRYVTFGGQHGSVDKIGVRNDSRLNVTSPTFVSGTSSYNASDHQMHMAKITVKPEIVAFVKKHYTEFLARQGNAAGIRYWSYRLASGRATAASVARGFVYSTEYSNRHTSNATFVRALYRVLLGRNPDSGGYNYWVNRLNQGTPRYTVLNGFIYSAEFSNRARQVGVIAR